LDFGTNLENCLNETSLLFTLNDRDTTYEQTRKEIETTFGSVPGFLNGVPQDVLVQMWPMMKTYIFGQSKIPPKYREMISLAVAATLKCPYCETFHRASSKMNGATDEELAELGAIVGQVTFWSSVLHTMNYDMDTFLKEFNSIGEHFAKQMQQTQPSMR
jgi:AhpD family alkylhydroperoxidase